MAVFEGVTFFWVKDGVNWDCFQQGLREWRKRYAGGNSASS